MTATAVTAQQRPIKWPIKTDRSIHPHLSSSMCAGDVDGLLPWSELLGDLDNIMGMPVRTGGMHVCFHTRRMQAMAVTAKSCLSSSAMAWVRSRQLYRQQTPRLCAPRQPSAHWLSHRSVHNTASILNHCWPFLARCAQSVVSVLCLISCASLFAVAQKSPPGIF